jgi:hypothetical protein
MNKLVLIFLTGLFFASCSVVPTASVSDFPMPSGIDTPQKALDWVWIHKTYKVDETNRYRIQTPAETLEKGYGECKAYSTLLIAMLYRLGYDAWFITGYEDGDIIHGGHEIVFAPCIDPVKYIEPQTGGHYESGYKYTETSRMSFKTYMMLVDGGWQSY